MMNSIRYTGDLEAVSLSRDQAETHLKILSEVIEMDIAKKKDIEEVKHELEKLEYRITLKVGVIVSVVIGTAFTVFKLTS